MEAKEFWYEGDIVTMKDTDSRKGRIVGFPKIYNAAMAWVVWDGNKRKMSVPIILLEKVKET